MRMRWPAAVLVLLLVGTASADDGYFFEESLGGAGYRGELARYGGGAPRFQFGVGVRRGAWTVTGFGAALVPDFYAIDCYGEEECAAFDAPSPGLGAAGIDLRKRWRLLSLRRWGRPGVYERPGVFASLRAGPRWFFGNDALDGFSGPGLGGAASLEGDLWVLGYFVDFGIDLMRLQGPEGTLRGSTPYLMFGAKVGWL
jgi:hypothetical protein